MIDVEGLGPEIEEPITERPKEVKKVQYRHTTHATSEGKGSFAFFLCCLICRRATMATAALSAAHRPGLLRVVVQCIGIGFVIT